MGDVVEMPTGERGAESLLARGDSPPSSRPPRAVDGRTAQYAFDRWDVGARIQTARIIAVLSKALPFDREPFITRQIVKFADDRYALVDVDGKGAHGLGAPVKLMEAHELALLVLEGDREAVTTPAVTHALALALLALIGEGAQRALPVARGAS